MHARRGTSPTLYRELSAEEGLKLSDAQFSFFGLGKADDTVEGLKRHESQQPINVAGQSDGHTQRPTP